LLIDKKEEEFYGDILEHIIDFLIRLKLYGKITLFKIEVFSPISKSHQLI